MREQFELEHLDAALDANAHDSSLFADGFNYGLDGRRDEAFGNLQEFVKKNRLTRLPGSKYNLYSQKKEKLTFGTTKRFAPEPGSVNSVSQQRILNSFKQ